MKKTLFFILKSRSKWLFICVLQTQKQKQFLHDELLDAPFYHWQAALKVAAHAHDPAISPRSEIRRMTSVTDEGPTTSSFLFRWLASCRRAPQAKWHQLRTKREIGGWEAKAFTDPLKICKRIPSRGITCKKYNKRWESISSIIHDIYASCFNADILRDTFSIVGNNNNYRDICLWFSTHTFGKVLSLIPFKTEEKCQR